MHLLADEIIEGYISGTKCIKNSFTLYEIQVITNFEKMKNHQIIFKRYSDFLNLHKKISKFVKDLPSLPTKKFYKLKEEVVKERMMKFNFYIKYICMLVTKKEISDEGKQIILTFLSN